MASRQIRIFVINLKRSIERRREIEKLMSRHSISFEFYEAIDGQLLDRQTIIESRKRSNLWYKQDEGPNESMKLGEIGVALSHYNIYQKIIQENIEMAIVLEDDANFDERFGQFLKYGDNIYSALKKFDLMLLGYCTHDLNYDLPAVCSYIGREKISEKFIVGKPVKWYWSAIGYVISKKGALLLAEKQGRYPCVTADILTANSPRYGVSLGVINQPIIWPGELSNFSTIQVSRQRAEASLSDDDRFLAVQEMQLQTKRKNIFITGIKYPYRLLREKLRIEMLKLSRNPYKFSTNRY